MVHRRIGSIPGNVSFIIKTLEADGFEAYAVGGCVRDMLLGKEPGDWDICTSAKPEQTKACFPSCGVLETGLKHGTVTLRLHGQSYEITTFRVEGDYSDHRRPDSVEFVRDVKADLGRRDFTINAMAYHPRKGLLDFFGGQQDLEKGLIRCVGKAETRFEEDALRMMRALRFASTYGFEIEGKTAQAMKNCRMQLKEIAPERIRQELVKLLMGQGVLPVLSQYWPVLEVFLPEIGPTVGFCQKNPHHCFDVWGHIVAATAAAEPEEVVRIAVLLHDLGKPECFAVDEQGIGHFRGHSESSAEMAQKILHRLKFDRITQSAVVELVKLHDAEVVSERRIVKRWLNRIGEEQLRRLLLVKRADVAGQSDLMQEEKKRQLEELKNCMDAVILENQCFSMKDLHINGTDLIEIGITEGRYIGQLLKWALDEVLDERLENRGDMLRSAVLQQWERMLEAGEASADKI